MSRCFSSFTRMEPARQTSQKLISSGVDQMSAKPRREERAAAGTGVIFPSFTAYPEAVSAGFT